LPGIFVFLQKKIKVYPPPAAGIDKDDFTTDSTDLHRFFVISKKSVQICGIRGEKKLPQEGC